MSSARAGLVAAILEKPEDDAPRLVAADWFEDQGDEASVARAEFIRTQVKRARLAPDDPLQSELQARELRLLKRYAPAWCGSHFVFRKVRFRRGFIEYVHLHLQHFLHHRRQMFALEPVRDIRLTGWHRAPTDLVRRVAACEEWRHVGTLRIHHQGPHKDPGNDVVLLLESPYLTRLRSLHCPSVGFDADGRRRFEDLPVLRHLRELSLPFVDSYPRRSGDWFSDAGVGVRIPWEELRVLHLPGPVRIGLLNRLAAMPFWSRLTRLSLTLPLETGAGLSILRDQLPEGLEELCLHAGQMPADFSTAGLFVERLAQVPLKSLRLAWVPLDPATLSIGLGSTSRWDLRELSLSDCGVTEEHARAISLSPATRNLVSLNLSENQYCGDDVARTLFSADEQRSVVHLNLSWTRFGAVGSAMLAAAKGWEKLRSLDLSHTDLGETELRVLLCSPTLHNLTSLTIGGDGFESTPLFALSPDLATELTQLPYLVGLRCSVDRCDPPSASILSSSVSLPWTWIQTPEDDIHTDRHYRSPERQPPIDPEPDW